MPKDLNLSLTEPVESIWLMIQLTKPLTTTLTVWSESRGDAIYWDGMFDIIDIYVNDKPFYGLTDNKAAVRMCFSSTRNLPRSLRDKVNGTGGSNWANFSIDKNGRYNVILNLDINRFDYASKCQTLIVSSHDMRGRDNKPLGKPFTYEDFREGSMRAVPGKISFLRFNEETVGNGGPRKRKPKMTLQSYFDTMSQENQLFN